MPPTTRVLLMVTLVLSATSCSRSNNYAAGPAENYFHDLGNRNFSAACQLFTDDLRRQLGDCPATLRKRLDDLPVSEVSELQNVSVGRVINQDKGKALVYPRDVTTHRTITVKVKGSPAPRSSAVRSIAANHATDGKALQLTKTGDVWQISGLV
jgi:hypothetical protein